MTPVTSLIEVGILFSPTIRFRLNGCFTTNNRTVYPAGTYTVTKTEGKYFLKSQENKEEVKLPLLLRPVNFDSSDFELTDVVIGIQFHWERKENQRFKGQLKIIDEGVHLTAVNILSVEDYLLSVISSEMSATSSLELLKAHAVISRSWLLAQKAKAKEIQGKAQSCSHTGKEYIRWYDREDHQHFDVCADDHCQRYQGITKAYTPEVQEAVNSTCGEVLVYDGKICDARFSKCCGGITERFENTWEPVEHPYLTSIADSPDELPRQDLSREEEAEKWIRSTPPAFCNTDDQNILTEVLNDYDRETRHFFRWKESFTTQTLSELVHRKLGIDFGTIHEIIPIERGPSGRLIRVKIAGSRKTMTIGKELVIRKAFSETHLYSSAFIIEKNRDRFTFYGAGWGHGVGLCQIGAAVMGAQGYTYRQILHHYFKGSQIEKIWEN
ncbi:SpoIID/LytB domain-containing protein [Odoribacter sp. Z80]|uniref:SpoIID/LytB domain-containing protein n=1 Tax=Odoribacter sp. Z80 TaxID=2304575 RepID=UPI001379566C|nr:SpoIID/LytB domain-containing protein [Odoribacter sp. Z80]NCE71739.1 SpoIID/LytB domain-containing protein [Odoribacter sp. Z80]